MRERARALQSRWRGVLLSLVGVTAIGWLAATGRLGLYIHPRYFEFTVVMAVLAGVAVVAAFALVPAVGAEDDYDEHDGHAHGGHDGHAHDGHEHAGHAHDEHEHAGHVHAGHEHAGHAEPGPAASRGAGRSIGRWLWPLTSVVIIAASTVALLVLPPATLTSATVEQRDLNASAAVSGEAGAPELVGTDTADFTVKDWASLLRQGAGPEYFAGKTATVTGFVTPDPGDPENVFYIARFVVTCCAVDAQPVGVPVHLPGWADDYPVDSWVTATGGFAPNPSMSSAEAMVLDPVEIAPVDQPADPYVY